MFQVLLVAIGVGVSAPLYAAVATLKVCNTGRIPIAVLTATEFDFITQTSWVVESWPIAAGECEQVYSANGRDRYEGEAAYIAFAFPDTGGQWGTGRVNRVPDIGWYQNIALEMVLKGSSGHYILTKGDKRFCMKRSGKTNYRAASEASACGTFHTAGANDAGQYMLARTALKFLPELSSCPTAVGLPVCSGGEYAISVVADARSGDVTVESGSGGVDRGGSKKTDSEDTRPDFLKAMADYAAHADEIQAQTKAREEADRARAFQEDAKKAQAATRRLADFSPSWMGQGLIVQGTVSRVEFQSIFAILHFQESPTFVVCFQRQMFAGFGGKDFAGLVGKAIEVRGRVDRPQCAPTVAGMFITVPSQITVN